MQALHKQYAPCNAGALAVVKVNTGEILAFVSLVLGTVGAFVGSAVKLKGWLRKVVNKEIDKKVQLINTQLTARLNEMEDHIELQQEDIETSKEERFVMQDALLLVLGKMIKDGGNGVFSAAIEKIHAFTAKQAHIGVSRHRKGYKQQ